METIQVTSANRITVVDALRGFALVSIMVLHNIEKFETAYGVVPPVPVWMAGIDKGIWDSFFFVFGGKSYAIFALLFGLTFFIQTHNREKEGKDFRLRFAWRLVLLLGFGFINTLFYQGEILVLYAIVGFFLIPFTRLGNRTIFIAALILLFQPIMWLRVVLAINNPGLEPAVPAYEPFYAKVGKFLTGDSLLALMKSNITNGRIASLLWYWEVGRITQTLGLFLLGYLAGRKRIFFNTPENLKFWRRVLIVSAIMFFPLTYIQFNTGLFTDSENIRSSFTAVITLWSNMALMLVMVSGFVLLFYNARFQSALNKLSPIGKMSLSNYIIQSMIGSTIYYGFGLGLYRYTGATFCLLIGISLAIAQGIFSTWWFKTHKRGPLESVWHKLTWLGTDKK